MREEVQVREGEMVIQITAAIVFSPVCRSLGVCDQCDGIYHEYEEKKMFSQPRGREMFLLIAIVAI